MNSPVVRRLGAVVASAAIIASTVAMEAPAHAVTPPTPLSNGATWLTNQIQSNGLLTNQYGTDYWTSADAAIALFTIGHTATASGLVNTLAANVNHYISNVDYHFPDEYSAGSTAKALVLAEMAGIDPTNFGGVNLVTRLEGLTSTTSPTVGRIADTVDPTDTYGADYANTIGQAFAARALTEAGASDASSALSFLLEQQCTAGYFRLYFTASKTAADQTCNGGVATGASAPDSDTTSFVLLELASLSNPTAATTQAITAAKTWLASQQRSDGSFGGGPTTSESNSNSTGLAGWALGTLGDTTAAAKAAAWVRGHQAQDVGVCTTKLSTQTGAIAYDNAGLAAGRTAGIPLSAEYSWNLATAQALPVLQWAPTTGGTLKASATTSYLSPGAHSALTVTGLVPGASACATFGSVKVPLVAGLTGSASTTLTMPAGTANRVASVSNGSTTATATFKVLAAKTLIVHVSTTIPHRSRTFVAWFSGFAPGERVNVFYEGRVIRRATASSRGTYAMTVSAGTKLGRQALVVTGQFANRRGALTITVKP